MPQTPLQICNSALMKVGGRSIPSFGYTASKEGELVTASYRRMQDNLLRSHVWHFAKTAVTLTSAVPSTIQPWGHTHTLPATCLRILSVQVVDHRVPYEIFGRVLHTFDNPVVLRYVQTFNPAPVSPDPVPEFPDDFAETLALAIATDIVVSLTQNGDLLQTLTAQYDHQLRMARFNGAVETPLQVFDSFDWLASRDSWIGDADPRPNFPFTNP